MVVREFNVVVCVGIIEIRDSQATKGKGKTHSKISWNFRKKIYLIQMECVCGYSTMRF
jgi:hypothetical protein